MKKTVWKNLLQTLGAVALMVGVWIVVWAAVGNELVVPSFWDCVKQFFAQFASGAFWQGFFSTLLRVVIAFFISFVLAGVLAVIAYLLPTFRRFFAPIVSVVRSVPVFAVVFVLLVWTNAGVAPVLVAFLSLFPMLYAGFFAALSNVDGELIEMSRVYKVPLKKRIFSLYVPAILPYAVREAGAALGFSVKLVASAEVVVRTARSLGGLMQEAQVYTEMSQLFALVIAVCLVGFLFEMIGEAFARTVERRMK